MGQYANSGSHSHRCVRLTVNLFIVLTSLCSPETRCFFPTPFLLFFTLGLFSRILLSLKLNRILVLFFL